MRIMINLSNHPSKGWSEEQIKAAAVDKIIDYQFPQIDPEWDYFEVKRIAIKIANELLHNYYKDNVIIHLAGEPVFVHIFARMFENREWQCVTSTTKRDVIESPDGTKISKFKFVKFRAFSK